MQFRNYADKAARVIRDDIAEIGFWCEVESAGEHACLRFASPSYEGTVLIYSRTWKVLRYQPAGTREQQELSFFSRAALVTFIKTALWRGEWVEARHRIRCQEKNRRNYRERRGEGLPGVGEEPPQVSPPGGPYPGPGG